MVLVQKWPFFQLFFLANIRQENVFFDILQRKNAFLGYKNKKFKKSKNWHFSKTVNPWFRVKNGHCSNFFFLGNLGQENVFLGYKNIKFKKSKMDILPNGLTHDFGPKMPFFHFVFFLGNIGKENVFYDILQRKNAFLGYKNKKFKKSKN